MFLRKMYYEYHKSYDIRDTYYAYIHIPFCVYILSNV